MKLICEIMGVTPLLLHNGRTANPLDPFSKELKALTSKRKKTDEDIKEILDLQWKASIYWSDKLGLYLPSENILAALLKGARMHKLGPKISGFIFEEPIGFQIVTSNHTDLQQLFADPETKFIKAVTIQKSKTISCRCILHQWEMTFECFIDESIISLSEVKTILEKLCSRVGFGVWTPSHPKPGTFGKFIYKRIAFIDEKTGETKEFKL